MRDRCPNCSIANAARRTERAKEGIQPMAPRHQSIHVDGGWRLEDFVVDHFLRCTEGDIFESMRDDRIFDLFNRRSGAIAAAVAINIENPG
jgi:hypothetical protein